MRALVLLIVLAACGSKDSSSGGEPPPSAQRRPLTVRVDRRIELVSLVGRLAKLPEYLTAPASAYVQELDRAFGKHAGHPAVTMTRELRGKHGITAEAATLFALALDDKYRLRDEVALGADPRWRGVDAATYAAALQAFAATVELDPFLARHAPAFARVSGTLRTVVESGDPIGWLEAALGPRDDKASFTIVPALAAGAQTHTLRVGLDVHHVIGVRRPDGMLDTGDDTLAQIVAALARLHVDPAIDRLRAPGEAIYKLLERRMAAQGLRTWDAMLKESAARALVILHRRDKKGHQASNLAARAELRRGFLWINELVELFRRGRSSRPGAMPDLAGFFEQLALGYAAGLPRTPFLGPVEAALSGSLVVVAPSDEATATYARQVHAQRAPTAPLVTASEQTLVEHAGINLLAIGAPAHSPVVAKLLDGARIAVLPDAIILGTRRISGTDLVLVFTWFRRDDPTSGVAVYTGQSGADLVGVVEGVSLVGRDWYVARKADGVFTIVESGDFPRAVDGAWSLP